MSSRIIAFSDKIESYSDILNSAGGKGGNLLRLCSVGASVPPFIVLTSKVFDDFVSFFRDEFNSGIAALDLSNPNTIIESSAKFRNLICSKPLPETLINEISSKISIFSENDFIAVRSSALGEDSKDFSYAGMLDSHLFQRGRQQILEAIKKCWSSMYSDRAVSYRRMQNLPQTGISMAVVVQKMIDGIASGVTFTVNPITKYNDEISINAVPGLGEGLVSGGVNADGFICIKRNGYPIDSRNITEKTEQIVFDKNTGFGTSTEPFAPDMAKKPCITEKQVELIAENCHKIEKAYNNTPLDIEWTIGKDNKLYILQARPITTITCPTPSEREHVTIWDNSNIVESYSGVTTPLTFSFALNAYHMVYVQFCQVLRVPESVIQQNDFSFANMLGLLNGRIYYNLKNWYRLVSVLPGYKYNSRFMEGMMGVKATFETDLDKDKKIGFFEKYFVELPRLAISGASLAWNFYTIESKVKDFMGKYQQMYDKYKDFDFDSAPAHRILDIYIELNNNVLRQWKAPIVNDFMAMIFYGVLKTLMKNWNLDTDGSLQNDLVAGQGNVESTIPFRTLQDIARFIVSKSDLLELVKKQDCPELVTRLIRNPDNKAGENEKELVRKIADYLVKFGYRTMNELKLEEPSLNEKPEYIFQILKNYLAAPLPPAEDTGHREAEIRENAEKKVAEILGDQKLFGFISKNKILRFVADYTKKAMAFREYQRFARTKMYGLARRIFMGIGQRFVERGLLKHVDDVFYLTQEEIISYVVGCAPSQKLDQFAAIRKAEFEAYRNSEELPDRIETKGIVYMNDLNKSALAAVENTDPNILRGIGGCSGKLKGRVKVILKPGDDMTLNGEILVAARTDPGWVPLFPSAAGLLIERGSMLSHSVIVARELGLPAIVGIPDVTKRLKTGDWVEMDGKSGVVRILSAEEIPQ
ncbi:MAG: hypothetical protein HQM10_20615 [Candidatus Riflebacteria bacterium]|nr:hypothetical protein [Candidatus Riflebacteria bacterium]